MISKMWAGPSRRTIYKKPNAENAIQYICAFDSQISMLIEKRGHNIMKILAADSLKPNKLKRHLETMSAECNISRTKLLEFNKQK
jgi:hypothetical protein